MNIKDFKSYIKTYSKDPKNFERRIALATPNQPGLTMFNVVNNPFEAFQISKDVPLIVWNDFSFSSNKVHEEFCSFVYNKDSIPSTKQIMQDFREESFVPKVVTDRSLVKKMKFPIVGMNDEKSEEFKTYGKFKKSEEQFDRFQEKKTPVSRFEILASGENPIHVQKKINKVPFDVDLDSWKNLKGAKDICKKINAQYSPEYYTLDVLESDGQLYLESIGRSPNLTPSQGVKLYESAYENYYQAKLPNWFKHKMFEDHLKDYYRTKYYDSLLLKPKGVIDYQKYID